MGASVIDPAARDTKPSAMSTRPHAMTIRFLTPDTIPHRYRKLAAETFARSAKLSEKLKDLYLDFWQLKKFPYSDTGAADFHTEAPTGFYYPKSPQKPYKKGA